MRARVACSTLAATLWTAAAAAQAPLQQAEAHSHIASAFVTGADPRVMGERVTLGPTLRRRLGDAADSRKVYDALVDATAGREVRVRALSSAETAPFLSVPGVSGGGEPLFALQAEDLVLVLQYAPPQKSVTFIEQLSAAPLRAAPVAAPAPKAAPKPAPPPPAPEVPRPAPVAKPAPPPVPPAPSPVAAKPAAALKPAGECVIKPVMSDQDFVNCGATPRQPVIPR